METRFVLRDPGTGAILTVALAQQRDADGAPPLNQEELPIDHPDLVARDLRKAREDRCDEVDALYAAKLLAGFTYQGNRFELNDFSQSKIGDLAAGAAFYLLGVVGVTWEPTVFVSADNAPVLFETADAFMPFANAAKIMAKAMFARRFVLKQACRAAATAEDLAAIDITTGWPE